MTSKGHNTPFTMSMSHCMVHQIDGMEQVDLYQLVLNLHFSFASLFLTLDLSHRPHWP